jgi:hypothetical protein
MRRLVFAVLGSLALAAPVAAQSGGISGGTVEIGVFGKYTAYPKSFHWTRSYDRSADDFGVGGRLGIFVARNLALEIDASHNNADIIANPPTVQSQGRWHRRHHWLADPNGQRREPAR